MPRETKIKDPILNGSAVEARFVLRDKGLSLLSNLVEVESERLSMVKNPQMAPTNDIAGSTIADPDVEKKLASPAVIMSSPRGTYGDFTPKSGSLLKTAVDKLCGSSLESSPFTLPLTEAKKEENVIIPVIKDRVSSSIDGTAKPVEQALEHVVPITSLDISEKEPRAKSKPGRKRKNKRSFASVSKEDKSAKRRPSAKKTSISSPVVEAVSSVPLSQAATSVPVVSPSSNTAIASKNFSEKTVDNSCQLAASTVGNDFVAVNISLSPATHKSRPEILKKSENPFPKNEVGDAAPVVGSISAHTQKFPDTKVKRMKSQVFLEQKAVKKDSSSDSHDLMGVQSAERRITRQSLTSVGKVTEKERRTALAARKEERKAKKRQSPETAVTIRDVEKKAKGAEAAKAGSSKRNVGGGRGGKWNGRRGKKSKRGFRGGPLANVQSVVPALENAAVSEARIVLEAPIVSEQQNCSLPSARDADMVVPMVTAAILEPVGASEPRMFSKPIIASDSKVSIEKTIATEPAVVVQPEAAEAKQKLTVQGWLSGLGLQKYEELFTQHEVDEVVLPNLTLDDLKDMGVAAVGSRRKMFMSICEMKVVPEN